MIDPALTGRAGPAQRSRPLLRTALGNVLRRARIEQGRTLADVASAAKVSMPYLSELERGRKESSSEVLAAICGALNIDLAELLAMVESDLVAERSGQARHLLARPDQAQVVRLRTDHGGSMPRQRAGGDLMCMLAA